MRILFFTLIMLMSRLSAQDPAFFEEDISDSLIDEENKETMRTMMIWKLTEELDLREEQADRFFPRFRKHRKEIDMLKSKERLLGKSLSQNKNNKNKLTGSEVNKIIKESTTLRKKMADLEEKFLIESGDILDPNQQAKLGLFKQKMMKDMKGKMKKRHKRRGMKDGKKFRKNKKQNKRGYWN